jgi:PmbA protein
MLDRAAAISAAAMKAGADAAEACMSRVRRGEVRVRDGEIERTVSSDSAGCGLRVDMGVRQGFASSTDLSGEGVRRLVEAAVAMAGVAPEDPHGSIPEISAGPRDVPALEDPAVDEIRFDEAFRFALRTEEGALAVDGRIHAGEGSLFAHGRGEVAIASTRGAGSAYTGTHCTLVCSPVASSSGEQQRQHWHESRRFLEDLPSPEEVGSRAGRRALRMLGARPLPSGRVPVVFDPLEGARFWDCLGAALLGDAARRRVSFLADDLGRAVAAPAVTLVEDPTRHRAPGSCPFDGEGVPTARLPLIEGGILRAFLYDTRSARMAGAASTGSAVRGYASPPVPGLHAPRLEAGDRPPAEILAEVGSGLYVTQMIGFGMNLVTGDFSRGASGWWFENGEYAYPVQKVTLSGNLREILGGIVLVADDLVERGAAASPTFVVEGMVASGGGS